MGVDEVQDAAWQRWQQDLFSRKQLISDAMQMKIRQNEEKAVGNGNMVIMYFSI